MSSFLTLSRGIRVSTPNRTGWNRFESMQTRNFHNLNRSSLSSLSLRPFKVSNIMSAPIDTSFSKLTLNSTKLEENIGKRYFRNKTLGVNKPMKQHTGTTGQIVDFYTPDTPQQKQPFFLSWSYIKGKISRLARRGKFFYSLRKTRKEIFIAHKEKWDYKEVVKSFPEMFKQYNLLVLQNDINGLRRICSNQFATQSLSKLSDFNLKGKKLERKYGNINTKLVYGTYFRLPNSKRQFVQLTFKVESTQAIEIQSKNDTVIGEYVPITEYFVIERDITNPDPNKWTIIGQFDPKKETGSMFQ